jgi:hypothetical protein
MTVADEAVATLHDLLARRFDEYTRRLNQLSKEEASDFSTMVNAAFFEAARRRFMKDGKAASDADVIDYVAYARSWDEGAAEEIDPQIGELMINFVIEKLSMDALKDIDNNVAFRTKMMLLAAFTRDADYSEDEVAEFMEQAKEVAKEMLA